MTLTETFSNFVFCRPASAAHHGEHRPGCDERRLLLHPGAFSPRHQSVAHLHLILQDLPHDLPVRPLPRDRDAPRGAGHPRSGGHHSAGGEAGSNNHRSSSQVRFLRSIHVNQTFIDFSHRVYRITKQEVRNITILLIEFHFTGPGSRANFCRNCWRGGRTGRAERWRSSRHGLKTYMCADPEPCATNTSKMNDT